MPDELHLPSSPSEQRPRSSMTLMTALDDGTTINLTVSPAPSASSAVTTSTTFTHNSFSFQISTAPPKQTLSLRTFSPFPKASCSHKQQPSDGLQNPSSTSQHPIQHSRPSNMGITLPEDVVAIDTGKNGLLFYVAPDENDDNRLSYLESPNSNGVGDYKVVKIDSAWDTRENKNKGIIVSEKNKQVAAVTWKNKQNAIEIRAYYVSRGSEQLREVCKTGDGDWYIGSLSVYIDVSMPFKIVAGTSISASVNISSNGDYNLRVFAVEDGKKHKGNDQISVFKFKKDEQAGKYTWNPDVISSKITEY
ncbi:hypothetical protein FACUT_5236 [Fusarium acutatum]|uniref:Fucose-specific lectin n=1 Tax=Fusarium acutatum TaxID=78861 RepID=A0A8H4JVX5_9HYPO|nr:hypothetical protein FACUT_5236 [Fusarium acutatum]